MKFSEKKKLYPYQSLAVKNAIKFLWLYYQKIRDFKEKEDLNVNNYRKEELIKIYLDNGLRNNLDIDLKKIREDIRDILIEAFPEANNNLNFEHLINRMSFWMATGSGKSLIIVKLIEILKILMDEGEIPNYDILFLTHRDDLLSQFKVLVNEFNSADNYANIILKELRELPEVKKFHIFLNEGDIIVYYYRSDNLSDIQKEKIIDFRNYSKNGKFYVFLDEAHKGDKDDSKRQQIFSIISRNGFLFNFSATFIDMRDINTCIYEFNLSSFINAGYGKKLKILEQEILAFRNKEIYDEEEKINTILKSLIILTYVKKQYLNINKFQANIYHKPLYVVLGKTVNIENADLELFFNVIYKICKTRIKSDLFDTALDELVEDLNKNTSFMFLKDKELIINETELQKISQKEILKLVFNAENYGEIEVLRRASNIKELAFKSTNATKPFALLKIGDITAWIKEKLKGFILQERYLDDSFFDNLNEDDSDINILLGSQTFYEGWDSNRPNIINFINIGMAKEAKKFILQSIGRGVRIEPIKDERKRLIHLYNSGTIPNDIITSELYNKIKDRVSLLETLFIYGTNREAITRIIQELDDLRIKGIGEKLLDFEKNPGYEKVKLLIPHVTFSHNKVLSDKILPKFELSKQTLEKIINYFQYISDDRILLLKYNTTPEKIKKVRDFIKDPKNFKLIDQKSILNIQIQNLFDYFDIEPVESVSIKELEDELIHYRHISVNSKNINKIKEKIQISKNLHVKKAELRKLYGKIPPEKYELRNKQLEESKEIIINHQKFKLIDHQNHFYKPLIIAQGRNIGIFKHIIDIQSEVEFINDLEEYLNIPSNKFNDFDWWYFSKLDESLDNIRIPYYDVNKLRYFYPDFIFWLKKGNDYHILFIDPKGPEYFAWADKINGFKELFEESGKPKVFEYDDYIVQVYLLLRTSDATKVKSRSSEYSSYWFDNITQIFDILCGLF